MTSQSGRPRLEELARDRSAQIEEFLASGRILQELAPEGRGLVFWLLRDGGAADGFRMIAQPGTERLSSSAAGFAAASSRPDEYPLDLPFVADCGVILNPSGASLRVHWVDVPDPLGALRSIVAQSEAAGWTPRDALPIELETRKSRYVELEKTGRVRIAMLRVFGNAGMLEMLDDEA